MIGKNRISVVIPCKNEEKVIRSTIEAIPDYVDEIIVVDNGSTDNTVWVAGEAGARVLSEKRTINGIGYGFAHMKGMQHATGDIIFAMDGDDTYPSHQIRDIVEKMEDENLDFVSCNRLPLKNSGAISKIRRLGIFILNIEVLVLYGKHIRDILTGMWAVRKSAVPALKLKMGDWNFSPEIKVSAFVNENIRFAEFHIDHFEREEEASKQAIWNTGFNHLLYILKRRFTQDNALYQLLVAAFEKSKIVARRYSVRSS
jgi:glycosyltransferase involved in cell wall biosynthesis